MKLFQMCNMEIIRLSQEMFNFVLPRVLIEKRANKFLPVSCLLQLINIFAYLFVFFLLCVYAWNVLLCMYQGSHASWKVLESPGFFFLKIPGPGKSWKSTLVLESPGN